MTDYPNRSDLRNPATRKVAFTGQAYGEAAQQQRAQQAVSPGSAPADVQAQQMTPRPRPGGMPLTRPTERPDEPLTAGADFGPGPTAAMANIRPQMLPVDDVLDTLKALYRLYPNRDLEQMIYDYVYEGS